MPQERCINMVLVSGLGNRIRPALSVLFIGRKFGIPVKFIWTFHNGCRCDLEDLFELRFELVGKNAEQFVLENYVKYSNRRPYSILECYYVLNTKRQICLCSNEYFDEFHRDFQIECDHWIASHFCQYFVPNAQIRGKIEFLSRTADWDDVIGVHVRRGDRMNLGPKPPPCESYFSVIDSLLGINSRIYLATDDGRNESNSVVIYAFKKRYGSRLFYQEKGRVNRGKVSVQEAVVDLWLLRKAGFLVGTKVSTFSKTAAIGKQRTLLV